MGRHGGINILHQKSWHVWRLDNRLTVERDELRHAAQEREKLEAQQQAAFDATVGRLRRRALGQEEEEEPQAAPLSVAIAAEGAGGSSSSGAGRASKREAEKAKKLESGYKYGMVTTSNLKQAEQDLDLTLKGRKPPERYWGSGGLGSGPHINLFEEAELEGQRHAADHQKQIGYTARNNELAEKSKKALFSEFDEIASDQPWYVRSPKPTAAPAADGSPPSAGASGEDAPVVAPPAARISSPPRGSRSRSRSGVRRTWRERHGQAVLQVRSKRRRAEVEDAPGPAVAAATAGGQTLALQDAAAPAELVGSSDEEGPERRRERRKLAKEEKHRRKKDKASKKDEELRALRADRERREREERARAARLVSGPGVGAWGGSR